jgi:hypothetical protein
VIGLFSAGNNEFWGDLRQADRVLIGLANRPLQPLGHLTASRNLSIDDIMIYGNAIVPTIVPKIVLGSPQNQARNGADGRPRR